MNGLWAMLPNMPHHSSYVASKFAVRGFTEALQCDMRASNPQMHVACVYPGHIGTNIVANAEKHSELPRADWSPDFLASQRDMAKKNLKVMPWIKGRYGVTEAAIDAMGQAELVQLQNRVFNDNAPLDGRQAARQIVTRVGRGGHRIMIGMDADVIDVVNRICPQLALTFPGLVLTGVWLGVGKVTRLGWVGLPALVAAAAAACRYYCW